MLACEQVRAARAILRWRAVDLAEKTGVSISTVQRTEKADGTVPMMPANERAVRQALEAAGQPVTTVVSPGAIWPRNVSKPA